jgi:hypothetical protein
MRSSVSIIVSPLLCIGDHRTSLLISNRSRSIQASLLIAGTCFLLAVLAGCRRPTEPVLYEDLCGLTSEQMRVMGEEDVRRWLEEEYDHKVITSVTAGDVSITTGLMWKRGGVTAYLRDGGLLLIQFDEIENGPTFGQVVASMGTPEMISWDLRTYGGHVLYRLGLDYPELGISVEGWREMTARELSRPAEEWTARVREDIQVEWVSCYSPRSSMEEVLKAVYRPSPSPDAPQLRMSHRMPWPGFGVLIPLDY